MKLYTEEQLRASYNDGVENGYDGYGREYEDQFINSLTPIELPSDEEIGQGCDNNIPLDEKDMWSERLYFRVGAKWVIDKIKNQQ